MQDLSYVAAPDGAPSAISLVKEIRSVLDICSLPLSLAESALRQKEGQDQPPIILFPGFASDERYMQPLGRYLKNLGYRSEGWGLGTNLAGTNLPHTLEDLSESWAVEPPKDYNPNDYKGEGSVPYLCDRATEQVRSRIDHWGRPVTLIGWSLGGYVAREVARELPHGVTQVITLGSPVIGGPKYTKAARVFKARGFDLDWIEREVNRRNQTPIRQPITVIYSRSDGIVTWQAAIDKQSPNVNHVEVNAAHLGLGFNRSVFKIIRHVLKETT